ERGSGLRLWPTPSSLTCVGEPDVRRARRGRPSTSAHQAFEPPSPGDSVTGKPACWLPSAHGVLPCHSTELATYTPAKGHTTAFRRCDGVASPADQNGLRARGWESMPQQRRAGTAPDPATRNL